MRQRDTRSVPVERNILDSKGYRVVHDAPKGLLLQWNPQLASSAQKGVGQVRTVLVRSAERVQIVCSMSVFDIESTQLDTAENDPLILWRPGDVGDRRCLVARTIAARPRAP